VVVGAVVVGVVVVGASVGGGDSIVVVGATVVVGRLVVLVVTTMVDGGTVAVDDVSPAPVVGGAAALWLSSDELQAAMTRTMSRTTSVLISRAYATHPVPG